jgi:UDP-N-acetylglucosamine:LPS N-acetylglucosamine transferase
MDGDRGDLASTARLVPTEYRAPRVLVVSASVGEGHNAAAAALVGELRTARPECAVSQVGTLGTGAETFAQRLYRLAIQLTPFLQDLWYSAVSHSAAVRWFYREVVGRRVGRSLAAELVRIQPDVVLSTYPLGTAGLAWLRRRGLTDVPVVAVLSDFAPHAFWVYPGVARYLVLSEAGVTRMRTLAPDVPADVCAPLVPARFHPPSERQATTARERHGIPADTLAVLISCGALGLGSVVAAVRAVLAAGPRCYAVVVCGRNEPLRDQLRRRYPRSDRLLVLGWVEDMADLMAGIDVVLNNAGGVTASETLASGRALVMFRPIAGHGKDCAQAMAEAGLAMTGTRRRWLTRQLAQWAAQPARLQAAQARAARHAGEHELAEAARLILTEAELPAPDGRSPEHTAWCPGETGEVAS